MLDHLEGPWYIVASAYVPVSQDLLASFMGFHIITITNEGRSYGSGISFWKSSDNEDAEFRTMLNIIISSLAELLNNNKCEFNAIQLHVLRRNESLEFT